MSKILGFIMVISFTATYKAKLSIRFSVRGFKYILPLSLIPVTLLYCWVFVPDMMEFAVYFCTFVFIGLCLEGLAGPAIWYSNFKHIEDVAIVFVIMMFTISIIICWVLGL